MYLYLFKYSLFKLLKNVWLNQNVIDLEEKNDNNAILCLGVIWHYFVIKFYRFITFAFRIKTDQCLVREAAKKVLSLVARPLRPLAPPPRLSGHRNFFPYIKKRSLRKELFCGFPYTKKTTFYRKIIFISISM